MWAIGSDGHGIGGRLGNGAHGVGDEDVVEHDRSLDVFVDLLRIGDDGPVHESPPRPEEPEGVLTAPPRPRKPVIEYL